MNATGVPSLPAIDVHAHVGRYVDDRPLVATFMTGDGARVASLAARANTEITVVSSLRALMPPEGYDVLAGNEEALGEVEAQPSLRLWAVLEPRRQESFAQVEALLGHPRCAGIKIHPELHGYSITEHGRDVFAFAARHAAPVITHSGEPGCMPEDFVPFADAHPEVPIILAHLGHAASGALDLQVRAIQASRHRNLYTDTSSSMSVVPGLIEWAVAQVGAERILYGTDSPLYFAPMQRARIDNAEMPEAAKRLILRDNALRVLGIDKAPG